MTSGAPEPRGPRALAGTARRAMAAFPWHLRISLALNAALNAVNALTGWPWWAFWPLVVSAFALAVHYLLYKSVTVDEGWAEARTEELNLKSYDRSHIEGLKERYPKAGEPDPQAGTRGESKDR